MKTKNRSPIENTIFLIISLTLLLVSVYFFLSVYQFSFNHKTSVNDQYYLVFVLPVFLILLLGWSFHKQESFNLLQIIGIILILACFSLISFSDYYSFGNEHFFVLVIIVLIGFSGLFIRNSIQFIQIGIVFFLLAFGYEVFLGLKQWIAIDNTFENASLLVCGSLRNSGIYGCYLAIHIPFLYWLIFIPDTDLSQVGFKLKNFKNRKIFYLARVIFFVIMLILVGFLVFEIKSRTAIIALFIIWGGQLIIKQKSAFRQLWIGKSRRLVLAFSIILIVAISASGYYLFYIKKMSVFGRWLMLQISWNHIGDNLWFGTGLGRFSWYYPQWQAHYFATNIKIPQTSFLAAGESYFIFNEHFQLLEEIGLVGFIFFAGSLIYFFRSKSVQHKGLLDAIKITMVAILACGLSSYPLHVTILFLLFAFCFAAAIILRDRPDTLTSYQINKRFLFLRRCFIVLLLILSGFSFRKGFKEYEATEKWASLRDNYSLNINSTLQQSQRLLSTLRANGKFLTEYGDMLASDTVHPKDAIVILEEAKSFFLSRKTIEVMADVYKHSKDYKKSIENYKWLSDFLPNLFLPKYELLKIYQTENDTANVRKTAVDILTMPVKIPSEEVTQIKAEAKRLIDQY